MFERLSLLVDPNLLKEKHLLIVGLGGVGGYALECLVRSGIMNFTLYDGDCFEETNLNRQLLAKMDTLGKAKVTVAKERSLSINPNLQITVYQKNINEALLKELKPNFDFIIDCCDDIKAKISLIVYAKENDIPIITCLGTANKLDPTKLCVNRLDKTYNDPLAKKLRRQLDIKYQKTPVVWSSELPYKTKGLGTICPLPMSAGSLIASYVLNSFILKK